MIDGWSQSFQAGYNHSPWRLWQRVPGQELTDLGVAMGQRPRVEMTSLIQMSSRLLPNVQQNSYGLSASISPSS
jgi:hypothetical protein